MGSLNTTSPEKLVRSLYKSAPKIELSYNPKIKSHERIAICNAKSAYAVLRAIWSNDINFLERVVLLLLSRTNKLLGYYKSTKGCSDGTIVCNRNLLSAAILSNSAGVILAHNHPSGNLKPSDQDIKVTSEFEKCCKLFKISLLDHLIVTDDAYRSILSLEQSFVDLSHRRDVLSNLLKIENIDYLDESVSY